MPSSSQARFLQPVFAGNEDRGFRQDAHAVIINIADNGPGSSDDQREAVFEPFVRLEASRNRDTGGVGMGLAIAQTIIQAHGGTVELRNCREGGLEAVVTLPMEAA